MSKNANEPLIHAEANQNLTAGRNGVQAGSLAFTNPPREGLSSRNPSHPNPLNHAMPAMATPAVVSDDTASPEGKHLSHNMAARAEPGALTGEENTVLTQAQPHAETFADRLPPSAAPNPLAPVTAVPIAQSHAATGAVGNHPFADCQQQQPSGQQTSYSSTAAFPSSAGSSPQVCKNRHRRQGPLLLAPPARNPPSRSTAASNSHAGSSATAGAGRPALAPAPLQPAITPGSATRPRSPVLGCSSPPPAPPHATNAPNMNMGSILVSLRAASSDTSPNISQTRAAANGSWSVNHLVAAAHAYVISVLTSAAHSPDSEPLPDTAYPEQAGRSQQTDDDATGSNSFFWAARLLLSRLWDSLMFCLWEPYNRSKLGIHAVMLMVLPVCVTGLGLVAVLALCP